MKSSSMNIDLWPLRESTQPLSSTERTSEWRFHSSKIQKKKLLQGKTLTFEATWASEIQLSLNLLQLSAAHDKLHVL